MFPLTHALMAQNLIKGVGTRVILGSVFPDLANAIGINRDQTHEMGRDFYSFCRSHDEGFLDFAQAIISHGANPPGLDYYADQSYQGQESGYCFQRGAFLVDKVIKSCGIPSKMGLWKAHNFIEMAFDVISVEFYPGLTEQFQAALEDIATIKSCSLILGHYFQVNEREIEEAFLRMSGFFCLNDVTPFNLAEKYARQLKKRHGVLTADPAAMAEVIKEAQEMVVGEYPSFMHDVEGKIAHLLTQYPIR